MKKINNFLKLAPILGLFSLIIGFSTCEYNLKIKEETKNSIDYDSTYEYLTENEARSLGELEKIYQKIDSINYNISYLPPYHAGEEEEGARIEIKKLNEKADSIINTLSELGKKESKTIYSEIFE
jgi:uncharacterized lipoprotein YehR (DUF1307 family)